MKFYLFCPIVGRDTLVRLVGQFEDCGGLKLVRSWTFFSSHVYGKYEINMK